MAETRYLVFNKKTGLEVRDFEHTENEGPWVLSSTVKILNENKETPETPDLTENDLHVVELKTDQEKKDRDQMFKAGKFMYKYQNGQLITIQKAAWLSQAKKEHPKIFEKAK